MKTLCYTSVLKLSDTRSYPPLAAPATLGHAGVFWVYAAVAALGLLFSIMFVPETKQRSLEEFEHHFR